NCALALCETSGFDPFGLRPAPGRLPPCCGSGRVSCLAAFMIGDISSPRAHRKLGLTRTSPEHRTRTTPSTKRSTSRSTALARWSDTLLVTQMGQHFPPRLPIEELRRAAGGADVERLALLQPGQHRRDELRVRPGQWRN